MPARRDPSLPDSLREYGEIWTALPKVLVLRTRDRVDHDTRVIGGDGDAIERLAELRATAEGDIGVRGATLVTQLLRARSTSWISSTGRPRGRRRDAPLRDPRRLSRALSACGIRRSVVTVTHE